MDHNVFHPLTKACTNNTQVFIQFQFLYMFHVEGSASISFVGYTENIYIHLNLFGSLNFKI